MSQQEREELQEQWQQVLSRACSAALFRDRRPGTPGSLGDMEPQLSTQAKQHIQEISARMFRGPVCELLRELAEAKASLQPRQISVPPSPASHRGRGTA